MTHAERTPDTIISVHDQHFEINDPLLDRFTIKRRRGGVEGVIADVMSTPLAQRALDITQLSKAKEHVTIPNTDRFNRFGHVAAITELIQRFAEREGVDQQTTLAYILSAAPSDLAHGPFSHATDIAVQGPGGDETFHEKRVPEAFELGGVNDVLAKHGIDTNERGEMQGITIPPWVESSAPDMCVDRLQYSLHEGLLWFHDSPTPEAEEIRQQLKEIASLDSIIIDDEGRMVFTNLDHALLLSKVYLLLSTEHWNDPVNRVQLYLLIESLKYSILNRRLPNMDRFDSGRTRQPYDYLFATDSDVLDAMLCEPGKTDEYLFAIEGQLADIGREEQRRFSYFKRSVFEQFLTDRKAIEYPSRILYPGIADFGPDSSRFEIERAEEPITPPLDAHPQVPQLVYINGNLHYELPPLKNRRIDPIVLVNGMTKPLSQHDKRYAELLDQHQTIQGSSLYVHVPTTAAYRDLLGHQAQRISRKFFRAQRKNDPMNRDPKRRSIEAAAERAIAVAIERGYYIDHT